MVLACRTTRAPRRSGKAVREGGAYQRVGAYVGEMDKAARWTGGAGVRKRGGRGERS